MNATMSPEYRQLELDSSNDIIRHDARRSDRKYEEAAIHARQAGTARARMGQMMFDEGQFVYAAEDWLSAAACFYLATHIGLLAASIERVRKLDHSGHIPAERRDLHAAQKEREEQQKALNRKLTELYEGYKRRVEASPPANQDALDFLLTQLRELPGYADLHFAIYRQAKMLSQEPLAAEHLRWAATFDPDNPEFVGRYGYHLIASGYPAQGVELGHRFVHFHPTEPTVRVMLAQALASSTGGHTPDRQAAIKTLEPVLRDTTNVRARLGALYLSAAIRAQQGHEDEFRRLLSDFDHLSEEVASLDTQNVITKLRKLLSQQPTNGHDIVADSDLFSDPLCGQLIERNEATFPPVTQPV
jgi:hypothetical protein